MKLTKKQRIINYAKQNPNGFTPKQLLADANIKDKNIWVTLSGMKKAGVLVHDPKTSTYRLATPEPTSQKKVLKPFNKKQQPAFDPAIMLDNILNQVQQTEEKYQDALAIIRYLEGKLYTVIQRDARSQG